MDASAPRFVLPKIDNEDLVDSDTLFAAYGATLLAFWTTHCTECTKRMQRCQQLLDWGEEEGLNVIGINFDEYPTAKTRLLAHGAGPRMLHLYDPGGRTAAVYGAGSHSFSAFLVDEMGIIREVHHEIMPDALTALRPSLARLLMRALGEEWAIPDTARDGASPGGSKPVTVSGDRKDARGPGILEEFGLLKQQRLDLHGRGRIRWMHIDTTGTGAVGSNGEPLQPGPSLRHRMELELSYEITPHLHAGGLIRLSNEGQEVLRSGPDYLSSEWGSAFVRHDVRGHIPVLARLLGGAGSFESSLVGGYYRVAMTPLTLMRWDQDDTPISGGQRAQGCGDCGGDAGTAGFIRSESLEKLGPDVTFEGARWDLSLAGRLDLQALYARPQTPRPSDSDDCCEIEPSETFYHQDLYALRAVSHFSLPWGAELFEIAGTAVMVREDADNPSCMASCMREPFDNRVLGADASLPLPCGTNLTGEVAQSHLTPNKEQAPDDQRDAMAFCLGATHELRAGENSALLGIPLKGFMARLEAAYQYIGSNFFSPYGALSYEPNLEGFRGAVRVDWGSVGVGGFFKLQRPIHAVDAPSYGTPLDDRKITASCWIDAAAWPGGVLMVGCVFEDRDLFEPSVWPDELGPLERRTMILSAEQELAPKCILMAEAEWLDGEWLEGQQVGGSTQEVTQEYSSTIVRVMIDVEF
ncbi:MAG: redoxin domain-containing protein [Candidatus Eisenbacteria sp.]|nr:redoxin domain-containing protein [Candidatus Eisenbacteria bacterium]